MRHGLEKTAAVTLAKEKRYEQTAADYQGRNCQQQFTFKALKPHVSFFPLKQFLNPSVECCRTTRPEVQ